LFFIILVALFMSANQSSHDEKSIVEVIIQNADEVEICRFE